MSNKPKFDPFTGAQLRQMDPVVGADRMGVPPDKFGMHGTPVRLPDNRQGVMMMVFPPEELRDQPLHVIEAVIAKGAQGLLKALAAEIYRSYTSDPVDVASMRNAVEAMQGHIDGMMKDGGR